ncbi:Protein of unknown function [Alkalithermobacter thermoalcaliphilus JW-YL-7 = DSM 7308]|uniref:DUF4230 domain-containing protein n=1 Tax=Alkalithermobacter thermoalcaliphilus JW-YL-7 = DSM 7308 TaxID=1121328 RepID=A0A150FNK9_CLOPD|nr:Protein of unknown function DUF4230 [[Clostridium] paradoxum JW-YL-7 = DSM 7308]SHK91964.1 Protein of unknown function [[Clostridium] paradoxum JW-YL-7 = DSM 7308]
MISKINKIKIILLVLIIIVSFISVYKINRNFSKVESNIIMERLSTISELSTTKYYYSNIISFRENKRIKEIEIPFTEKSFLIKYEGYIKAGIKLDSVDISVDKTKNSITVKLDKAVILEHNIDEKNVYVYDEKNAIFNRLSFNDMINEILNQKKLTEKEIIEKGFLDEASENSRKFLEEFFKDLGYQDINIIFNK